MTILVVESAAMQLWFARGSGVSIRDQLVTQIVLGILSGDLAPGQRLPSTRELSRRFLLHPNTASAGYRQLRRNGWVEFRRGSGIYVRSATPDTLVPPEFAVEHLFANLLRSARMLNIPLVTIRSRLRQWLEVQPPDRFLLVEADDELRQILIQEIRRVVTLPVVGSHAKDPGFPQLLQGSILLSLPGATKMIGDSVLSRADPLILRVNSVPKSLARWLPAPTRSLIGIASRWPGFLKIARDVLSAGGFQTGSLLFRDARKAGWQRGLKEVAAVVCDSVTATGLPKAIRAIVFPLLSEAAINDLRRYDEFVRTASVSNH